MSCYFCNAVEDVNSIDAVQRTGQRTKELLGMLHLNGDDKCFTFITRIGVSRTYRDEKKEPVLDFYVPGAQSKILLNLVSGSMLLLATIVGEEKGTYQMFCALGR